MKDSKKKIFVSIRQRLSKIRLLKELSYPIYKVFENRENFRFRYNRLRILFDLKNRKKLAALKNIHKGKQCIIMATGPSLNKVDLSLIKKHPFVFGVHGTFVVRNNFKYYFCSGPVFYKENWQRAKKEVDAELFFFSSFVRYAPFPNAVYISVDNKKSMVKLEANLMKTLPWGPGVLLDLAIPVALWMGFSEIILLGADYSLGEYKRFYEVSKNALTYKTHISQEGHHKEVLLAHKNFEKLKKYLSTLDKPVKIFNCSPLSDLKTFEKPSLKKVLKY